MPPPAAIRDQHAYSLSSKLELIVLHITLLLGGHALAFSQSNPLSQPASADSCVRTLTLLVPTQQVADASHADTRHHAASNKCWLMSTQLLSYLHRAEWFRLRRTPWQWLPGHRAFGHAEFNLFLRLPTTQRFESGSGRPDDYQLLRRY